MQVALQHPRNRRHHGGLFGMDPQQMEPTTLFGGIVAASSLAGLGALLRSGRTLTTRAVASSLINSGILGGIVALAQYKVYAGEKNLYLLIAISVLAGLGGTNLLEFIMAGFRRTIAGYFPPAPTTEHKRTPPVNHGSDTVIK